LNGRWTIEQNEDMAYQGTYFAQQVPGIGNGDIVTLRHRIDPGEWVLVSAWFAALVGSNGAAVAGVAFYGVYDNFLNVIANGNVVPPSPAYLESVLMVQAPQGAFYYRPGVSLPVYPTAGQWRVDRVFAISGSQQQVLNSRAGIPTYRNLIANGDFELGNVMFTYDVGWNITNNPNYPPNSGDWMAVHVPGNPGTYGFFSMTGVPIVDGHVINVSIYVKSFDNPNGRARMGVTWINAQGNGIGQNATGYTGGTVPNWTYVSVSMTAPPGAANAHLWLEVQDHTNQGIWAFDDWLVTITA
jgi:hypothetical protein